MGAGLARQDEVQRSNRIRMTSLQRKKTPAIVTRPMIIPDGDTGHGGEHHIRNLVKKFVENKIGAIHIEDQRAGCRRSMDIKDKRFLLLPPK